SDHECPLQLCPFQPSSDHECPAHAVPSNAVPVQVAPFHSPPSHDDPATTWRARSLVCNGRPKMSRSPRSSAPSASTSRLLPRALPTDPPPLDRFQVCSAAGGGADR